MNWKRFKAHAAYFPTLWWNVLLGRILKVHNWFDQIDENVFLGAIPFASDVPRMADLGVRAVVNTCEETVGPVKQYQRHGIIQLRIPTVDFTQPKMSDVEHAVQFMNEQIAAGGKVYVHCKAGRARSGVVAICWLIQNRQISAAEAQVILNDARPHVNQHLTTRPVVQQFEAKYVTQNPVVA